MFKAYYFQNPSNPSSTGTITEEHIKASIISAIDDKLRRRVQEKVNQYQAEIETLNRTKQELLEGSAKIDAIIERLEREHIDMQKNIRNHGNCWNHGSSSPLDRPFVCTSAWWPVGWIVCGIAVARAWERSPDRWHLRGDPRPSNIWHPRWPLRRHRHWVTCGWINH